MKQILIIAVIVLWLFSIEVFPKQCFKVMCYNVENFFDCQDDSLSNDTEYLNGGLRAWNYSRFKTKEAHIAKVIASLGGWVPPALVGLCEIENDKCLYSLVRQSGLKNLNYKYLHYESPDPRGIDVALLYLPTLFKPIKSEPIRISFPDQPNSKTRDVLYVMGLLPTDDTLHVFVCHFPSRLGGELESEPKRVFVAEKIREKVNDIFRYQSDAKIIIMGDFNDFPTNRSLLQCLKALPFESQFFSGNLYNLSYNLHLNGKGSNKHEGQWGALDQMIVSGGLLSSQKKIFTSYSDFHFYEATFLLEDDPVYLGKQPFRTYKGYKYQAGYSDHLPIYTDFWY